MRSRSRSRTTRSSRRNNNRRRTTSATRRSDTAPNRNPILSSSRVPVTVPASPVVTTMAFLLNPYDAELDLSNKEDRKLFTEGCKGVKEKDIFDGKKQNYSTFVKLIEMNLSSTRTMDALKINTKWVAGGDIDATKRDPLQEGEIDLFESNKVTKRQIEEYTALVWEDTSFGADTPKYFKAFGTAPTDTAELNKLRNARKLKHVMLGHQLWNSLSSAFKVEIIGSKKEFQKGQEYDGVLLWDFIRRRINPNTTVGASRLKDEIETTTPTVFDNDIIKYNTWFEDTRSAIIKEEGKGYNEYLRSLFRAYLTVPDAEFIEAVKDEKRDWIQGKLVADYDYSNLMDLGRVTFNNITDEDYVKVKTNPKSESKQEGEKNFLALATALMTKMSTMNGNGQGSSNEKNKNNNKGDRTYQPWRFENPENNTTKIVRGSTMNWCTNDCHEKPMWCGRRNCMNRADYSAAWKKKSTSKNAEKKDESSEFKIALAAMTSPEDFASLQEQFESLKD